MSLIQCAECKQDVSTEAKICPHCGNPDLPIVIEQRHGRKETLKALTGFTIIGLIFIWLCFWSGNLLTILLNDTPIGKIFSANNFPTVAQKPSGHVVPLQEVKNLGYDFYIAQIDSQGVNNLTDDFKNQVTKIVYDTHFPQSILTNLPIIILNNLALTGDQYVTISTGNLRIPDLKPDFLSEGGIYATFTSNSAIIFINKPIIAQGQLTNVLAHELGHAVGATLSDQDWKKYYQLRGITAGTSRHGTNWNLSPEEDFAEVYKNTFTGIDVRTFYGQLMPMVGMDIGSCRTVYFNAESNYTPKVDSSNPSAYWQSMLRPSNVDTSAIEAKAEADSSVQACRRGVMSNPSAHSSDWSFGTPYKSVVNQATKNFIVSIATRLNQK